MSNDPEKEGKNEEVHTIGNQSTQQDQSFRVDNKSEDGPTNTVGDSEEETFDEDSLMEDEELDDDESIREDKDSTGGD